jgi:hypothetical protein
LSAGCGPQVGLAPALAQRMPRHHHITYARAMSRLASAYCRILGHTGEWSLPDTRCVRTQSCPRCGHTRSQQAHTWTAFEYVAADRCNQERRCDRCGATETRALHRWGPWRYVGRDSVLLKLRQVRTCGRCGVDEEQEFERAF